MKKRIKIKICGMRDEQNIREVATLQPDYMGFIFYERSPRYTGAGFSIPSGFSPSIRRVGVFVNESTSKMIEIAERYGLDYLQLHGQESADQCRELRKLNIKIIKVFSVDNNTDFDITKSFQEVVNFFLFDTKGKYHGGNAQTFNWSLLEKYDQQVPFFLSGGLSADNISGIKELVEMNLHAVDLNSGVEIEFALKDPDKIRTLKHLLNSVV